ncbi:MAG: UvrD-helicase domain-containing protein [Oscillospiraceae bacterium]|nr:UvrD-helicase domain-containing protein [Oscillospiraceae bacterium]
MTEFEKRYIDVRKKIIEHDFARLNPEQRKAVMSTEGPLLILAGAGSGKTTVLINRIACILKYGRAADSDEIPAYADERDLEFLENYSRLYSPEDRERAEELCSVDPAEPWQVIAITFTNKAAGELVSRLDKMLGGRSGEVWASTFHSACVRILRRDVKSLGLFSGNFTIYDTSDSTSLMKHIMREADIDEKKYAPRAVLSAISAAKDAMLTPEEYMRSAGIDPWKKTVAELWGEYRKRMIQADSMDFDDLILYTVTLFERCPDVLEYYRRRFRYVLVDEYQDTNMLQYKLISLLSGGHRNICVVGDDDQGIYKFRGASIENILGFESQYADARVIKLEQNYRSTSTILQAANAVIRVNSQRKNKELWTDNEKGGPVTLYTAMSENDEAQYAASCILSGHTEGEKWSDYAVLYRINALSNRLEYAMKRNGIPYRVYGGMRFYDRAEIKDMLAYLCVINNPDDELRLRRIINNPPRGIGDTTIEKASAIAEREGKSLYRVLSECGDYPELRTAYSKIKAFTDMIEELRAAKTDTLDELYDRLVRLSGYMTMLEAKETQENITRAENISELKTNIISFVRERGGVCTLADFLDEMALYSDTDSMDGDDCVALMTIHSAKGLEFPNVFIVGAEDGIFPGLKAIGEQDEIEEERRLCYVAITRAKRRLWITNARQRMLFGRTQSNTVSRFIKDIPDELLDKRGAAQTSYSYSAPDKPYASARTENRARYMGGYSSGGARPEYSVKSRTAPSAPRPAPISLDYKAGESVIHKAFGKGMILSAKKMGPDMVVEIAFEKEGTKKLMISSAGRYLTKIGK